MFFRPNKDLEPKLVRRRAKSIGEQLNVYITGDVELDYELVGRVMEVECEWRSLGDANVQ